MVVFIKKIRRDFIKNKLNTLAVFFVMLLGIFICSSLISYSNSLEEYINNSQPFDLKVNGNYFTEEDLSNIKEIEGVANASIQSVFYGEVVSDERKVLQLNFIDESLITQFNVTRGEAFDPKNTGIWLDRYFARENNIRVGDTLVITTSTEQEIEEEVVGLILSPYHLYYAGNTKTFLPNFNYYGFAFLSSYHYEDLNNNVIIVNVNSNQNLNEVKNEILNMENVLSVYEHRELTSVINAQNFSNMFRILTIMINILFLITIILLVTRVMKKNMKKERKQIALLKTLGIKSRKIIFLYSSYIFLSVLFAGAIGLILGNQFSYLYHNITSRVLRISRFDVAFDFNSIILFLIVLLILTVITIFICKKNIDRRTAYLLSSNFLVARNRKLKYSFDRGVLSKFSILFKWRLRTILINLKKSIVLSLILIASLTTIIVSIFIINSRHHFIHWQYQKLYNYEYKLELNEDISEEDFITLIEKYGRNLSQNMNVTLNEDEQLIPLFIDSSNNLIRFTDTKGELFSLEDEGIYITEELALEHNVSVGDYIQISFPGANQTMQIMVLGMNTHPSKQGLSMTRETLRELGIDFQADTLYTNRSLADVNYIEGVFRIVERRELREQSLQEIRQLQSTLIMISVVAFVLYMVVIYHIGVIFTLENEETFNQFKLYGFQTGSIRYTYRKIINWFIIISILISIIISYLIILLMANIDHTMIFTLPIWICIGAVSVLIIVFSKVMALMFSKKIKTKNMIKELKEV